MALLFAFGKNITLFFLHNVVKVNNKNNSNEDIMELCFNTGFSGQGQ